MRSAILALLLVVGSMAIRAEEYKSGSFKADNGIQLPYRYLDAPQDDEMYPLVIFLHGLDERGTDNKKQLIHGGKLFANDSIRKEYPAMVIFPQCPETTFWAYNKVPKLGATMTLPANEPQTAVEAALVELIDSCASLPNVDADRIYLTGISMGGMAVFDLVARYPDYFAAAVPICGSIAPGRLSKQSPTAWRIFHGGNDKVVPPTGSRQAKVELEKAGTRVEYQEYPKVGHGVWFKVFDRPDFLKWMFNQSLEEVSDQVSDQPSNVKKNEQ